ncbi:MAG: serine/threonine protein kinase [Rhodospirillales bacterium]|nr:MAG: serine/threonine protein kinase [Rhodospirillales bacterium]
MAQAPAPARIGRYVVESTIGRGAMGVIYRAHDPMIDRPVALKIMRADLLEGDERRDYVERFQREAQAAGRCAHANIVAVYDFALHEDNPYLAMEFVDGRNLGEIIERGRPMAADRAGAIVRQMLDALACAHGQGVVHRDIKPPNVMLTADGRVKVADFGISRIGGSSLTQAGALIGTPNYMSPEQCRGEAVDARSDLFSTAAVLYELLTGELPFPGRNFHEIAHLLQNGAPVPLGRHLPDVSPALVSFMDVALARDPASRFPTAAAMSAALDQALRGVRPVAPRGDAETVVLPHAPAPAAMPAAAAAITEIAEVERRLARYVGPMAGHIVRTASGRATSFEQLCRSVSDSIEQPESRAAFLREMFDPMRASVVAASAASIVRMPSAVATPSAAVAVAQAELDLAQRDLARSIGPIAKVLVRREVAAAADAEDLWRRLAGHIERPADRAAFLRVRKAR